MTPLSVTAAIMSPAILVIVAIVVMMVAEALPASPSTRGGRHRAPEPGAVIDSVVVASDTVPIRVGGAR